MPPLVHLYLLLFFSSTSVGVAHRRALHQPFIPDDSPAPPYPSPTKYPSSETRNYPFFPTNQAPAPPFAPSSFASNVSSVSSQSGEDSASPKLISAAIAAVIAALIVVSLAVFIHLRRPAGNRAEVSLSQSKSPRSNDNCTASVENTPQSHYFPKLRSPSPTSAEILYLGTLANSCAVRCSPGPSNYSPAVEYHTTGSPELRPLPPLKAQQDFWQNVADAVSRIESGSKDFFFSPKSSENGGNCAGSSPVEDFALDSRGQEQTPATVSGDFHESQSLSSPSSSRRSHESSPWVSNFPEQSIEASTPGESATAAKESVKVSESLLPPDSLPSEKFVSVADQRICSFTEPRSPEECSPRIPIPIPSRLPPPAPPPPPPPPPPNNSPSKCLNPPEITPPLKPFIQFQQPISSSEPALQQPIHNSEEEVEEDEESHPKPKLKQLHWDKVLASSDRKTVWDQLKSSSFKLDEEMMQTLFVVSTPKQRPKEATRWQVLPSPNRDSNADRVLDPKKSQNIAILLKALHVTVDEVCEGLLEGNTEVLGADLLESLLKMAPTNEEEQKLKEYDDDSLSKLGAAETFLKAVVSIPFAFKRIEILLYISNFDSEVEYLKKSFAALEAACEALRSSRMFLKLLDAVLKTGNRMNVGTNRGDAQAFKLDTLLKLVDVKGADGKTTLLHFVVQEIIRSEGAGAAAPAKCQKLGLQVVSTLSLELSSVRKAAVMDADALSREVSKLSQGLKTLREFGSLERTASHRFIQSTQSFIARAEEEISKIQAQETLAMSMVKEITEYFHGDSAKEEAHPLRIFMVVRDFLTILDRVCEEVRSINDRTVSRSPQ